MTSIETRSGSSAVTSRRDEIVAAAVPIFLRFGYKKASMDSVAEAANLSRQAVYLYFPCKEALFAAVVDSLCRSTRELAHIKGTDHLADELPLTRVPQEVLEQFVVRREVERNVGGLAEAGGLVGLEPSTSSRTRTPCSSG